MKKKIVFISFVRWNDNESSCTKTAKDAFLQTIEMTVQAEALGVDGAFFRVHHFSDSLSSPLPLLSAIGAKTEKIEIGSGVIDLRYENPQHLAENAGATDLIMNGRLQLGLGRGAPWSAVDGWKHFGYRPKAGKSPTDMAMERAEAFLDILKGEKKIELEVPFPDAPVNHRMARIEPHSPTLLERVWWASGSLSSAEWAAKHGLNLQSAGHSGGNARNAAFPDHAMPVLADDMKKEEQENREAARYAKEANPKKKPMPFAGQKEHIKHYLAAWQKAGHTRKPRIAVIRELVPLDSEKEKQQFDQVTEKLHTLWPNHKKARNVFEEGYKGSSDEIVELMKNDEAAMLADTIMVPVANEIGMDFNLRLLEKVVKQIAPQLG